MILIIILIILVLVFILLFNNLFNNLKEGFDNNINIDINNIKRITKEIAIYRPVESDNLNKVKQFVMNELKNINLDVIEQKFTRNIRGRDYSFSNIIGTNYIDDKDHYILLGAHIDAPFVENTESATDAATCIAIIIELVKNLKHLPLKIVFFDGEEAINGQWSSDNTLSGSKYFVDNNNNNNIINIKFAIILDLIGGDPNKNKLYCFNNKGSCDKMTQLANINKKYSKQIFVDPDIEIKNSYIQNDFTPFEQKNIDGLNLIPPQFPDFHHTINDNYNNVNWEYVEIFTNVLYEFLYKN
jgi:hypothetical protein